MTHDDVQALIRDNAALPGQAELVETHISWVILSSRFVYKIKRPVQFSFLDFSTLEKRKFFCERELVLNQRLTTGLYLDVVPIYRTQDHRWALEDNGGQLLDFAVKMKRLDNERQMDVLLEKELVSKDHLEQLAQQLANFHMSTEVVMAHPNLKIMQEDFADLLKIAAFVEAQWGPEAALPLHKGVAYSKELLHTLRERIYERHLEGFTVDGHGDLHARNIFLLEEPVIFDCIEFNDHLRQLDVLNELAFLCMDLDFHGQPALGNYLLEQYNQRHACIPKPADEKIFQYYKLYRANVRLKIHALEASRQEAGGVSKKQKAVIEQYLKLFDQYLEAV